jgi:hypothetical protein
MEEYIESTRKGKILFYSAVFLLVFAAWGVEIYKRSFETDGPTDIATVEQPIAKVKNIAKTSFIIAVLAQPVIWLIAYALFRFGKQIKKSGHYPPPGSQIPFRMKIKKGKKAIFQAKVCDTCAVLIILFGLMHVYFGLRHLRSIEGILNSLYNSFKRTETAPPLNSHVSF